MQQTIADFELQFRRLVKNTTTSKNSPNAGKKSAYNTVLRQGGGDHQRRKKRQRKNKSHRSSKSTSNLAQIGSDFFADYGKPVNPLKSSPKRLTLGELEMKRLSLPFIDTIEFVRLQLEHRGIHSQEKHQPETTTTTTNVTCTTKIEEVDSDDDFEIDLSEFSSFGSNQKKRKRPKNAKDLFANMTEAERRETLATKAIRFSEIVTRARFPIFTDQLAPVQRKPHGGGPNVSERSTSWLLQMIEETYDARFRFDCSQRNKQRALKNVAQEVMNRPPPLNTPTFVYNQLEKQLGLKQLVNQTAWDMLYNMERCEDTVNFPEVELFRSALRELMTTEHFLFFLHCRHVIQTEHEITFASKSKMNITTCAPGKMMSSDPTGRTPGACLLTPHPLIHDSNTNQVWLSLPSVRQVLKKILYHDHLTEYMMNVRTIGKTLFPQRFWVSSDSKQPPVMVSREEEKNGEEQGEKKGEEKKGEDGIFVEVVSANAFLGMLVEEMRLIPKDKQVQFKHGDDSETVVLLANLQETERNKAKIDVMEKRIQNEKIAAMSQGNKVLMLERDDAMKNRTNLFLAKSLKWKLENIVISSQEELATLVKKDDAVWDDVVHQEHAEVDQMEEEKTTMEESIAWDYSEDVAEQLQIFQAWIGEEHVKYVRKMKVVAAVGKTYAQQIEERKHWAANLLQKNYRENRQARIEQEKARIEMEKKKEERRLRREKAKAANDALKKRREKEAAELQAKMDAKKKIALDARRKEEEARRGKYQSMEGQRRFRKAAKKQMSSRFRRWGLFVQQRRSKNKRLRENCGFIWTRWTSYVFTRKMWHRKRYGAAYTMQRMGRAFIAKMSVKIMLRKQAEQERRVRNLLRRVKYGGAHKLLKNWHEHTQKFKRVRTLMNSMATRFLHLCVKGWRLATVFLLEQKVDGAKKIQRCWRNREGMVAYMLKQMKNKSAYSIQGAWRAYCARTFLKRARATKEREESCIRKSLHRIRMRKLIATFDLWYEESYRLRVIGKMLGKNNQVIKEEHFDAWMNMYREHRPAAVLIQSTWKSFDARVKLAEVFLFARSARCMQSFVRVTLAKCTTHKLRQWRDSATTIQSSWRAKKCQIDLHDRMVNALLEAARVKDYLKVEMAFERGRGRLSNREGTTALHIAASVGSKRIVKLCVRRGMDIDTRDLRGRTPLHYLVEGTYAGQEELLEYMLSKGSRRNASDIVGSSVLAYAARLNHVECVITLIAMNAEMDQQDVQGFTAIHDAAGSGAWASVKALINMGHANVDLPDHTGCTPLHDVCARGHSAVLLLLLPATQALNEQDREGMTPLHHAVHGIHDECVRILLSAGAESEIQDHTGMFPIHLTSQDDRRLHILQMLCESFANLDVVDIDQQTALHLASIANVHAVVQLLLRFGATPSCRDSVGCQPIHLAARHGSVESAMHLFDYSVDVNLKNWEGMSAIGEARMNNQKRILELFDERYVLSRVVDRQREETAAENLGIHPPRKVETLLNVGELKPGAIEESPFWREVLSRSLKYRPLGHWIEYREVLPPKEWILNQRKGLLRKDAEYELRHWWENDDTGACTFQPPEIVMMGEWVKMDAEMETTMKEEKKKKKDAAAAVAKDGEAEEEEEEEEDRQPLLTSSEVTLSLGAKVTTTKWINSKTGMICVGLPPTALPVSHARMLEQKSVPENVTEALSLIDYQHFYNEERRLLEEMTLRWKSLLIIQTQYRGYKARCQRTYLVEKRDSAVIIQKMVRGMLDRNKFREKVIMLQTTVTLQRRRRGTITRRYLDVLMPQLVRRRNVVVAAGTINRVWRGYYPRRERRRLWWRLNGPKNNTDWNILKNNTLVTEGGDQRLEPGQGQQGQLGHNVNVLSAGSWVVRKSVLRKYDCFCVGGTYDVLFWCSRLRGTFTWEIPPDIVAHDKKEHMEERQLRLRGFTSDQERVAERLQAIWRGKKMVEQFRVILKARKIMNTCEEDYMNNPTSIETTCNYMLYVHLFPPHDFDRARQLYVRAMETMAQRGPDHPFILYSFLIFSTATGEEDDDVLFELARRAKLADIPRRQKNNGRSGFELAEIGFYRMAAVVYPDDPICQMNYAICLQWLRDDYVQAEEFYQRAARLTLGRDSLIMSNYNWMLKNLMGVDRFGEDALHEESKKQAVLANHEWNLQRAAEAEMEAQMNHAAAVAIQYRFRLRRAGLLRYWPFQMPSYRVVRERLLHAKKMAEGGEGGGGDDAKNKGLEARANPADWELCDDGNGNKYYYNHVMGESTWDRPDFDELNDDVELPLGPGWELEDPNEPIEDVAEWESIEVRGKLDEEGRATQMVYYHNILTGESRWRRPKLKVGQSVEDMATILDTTFEDARNWSNKDFPCWKVIFPEDCGAPYWWHEVTGQSSYVSPEHIQMELQDQEGMEMEVEMEVEGRGKVVVVEDENVSYPWSQEFDGEGSVYYYNEETGESQWTRPMDTIAGGDNGGDNGGDGDVELYHEVEDDSGAGDVESYAYQEVEDDGDGKIHEEDDWEECSDGQGSIYWWSESRQESTWECPS